MFQAPGASFKGGRSSGILGRTLRVGKEKEKASGAGICVHLEMLSLTEESQPPSQVPDRHPSPELDEGFNTIL